jgi:hypothetical protein
MGHPPQPCRGQERGVQNVAHARLSYIPTGDGESRSRVHFVRFQWLAAPFPSRVPVSTPKSRSRAAP